jgi:hypothetical protein
MKRRWQILMLVLANACNTTSGADDRTDGSEASSPTDPNSPGGSNGSASGGPNGNDPNAPNAPGDPNNPGDPSAVPYVHFDINHVLSTGQSNSVAHEGRPVLSTTQPYSNLMFDVGVMTSGSCEGEGCRAYQKPSSLVPLVEGDTFWWPVETMSSGMANEATKLATTKYGKPSHTILMSLAGRNGLTYWCLRKGGCNFIDPTYVNAFDESLMQVADAMAMAKAQNKSYVVRAVTTVHGESDDYAYATNTQEFPLDGTDGSHQSVKSYADGLIEWQKDYEAAVKQKTGQTIAVPLLVSQHSGWNDIATSAVAMLQYEAHVRSKGKVVLVTAGYPLDYNADCRHYSNHGERMLGEYFAKAYTRIVVEGKPFEPVHPKSVTLAGAVITAKFHVPKPPLVFDTQYVTDPGNYGFEVASDSGATLAIAKVELTGPDTVTITLASAPSGKPHLRYAYRTVPHTCPGRTQGARGNLRDSDDTPSQGGYQLFNWGVHFDVAIQ